MGIPRRFVSGHVARSPLEQLRELGEHAAVNAPADVYGRGGAVEQLEQRVAGLLGKPAAMFFAKGVTAQLAVLRVHAQRAGCDTVAVHPASHLDLDEANAIERVGGLRVVRVGRHMPFDAAALAAVTEPLAAVVVELPLRRAGYLLPPLDDLRAIAAQCAARGIACHIDGARLWESAAGYGIPVDALAALGDTVYVSFYKGLGGLGGAVLAGPEDVVRALAVWKTRLGGDLYTSWPQAVSALAGLDRHLGRMPRYVERARALAARLADTPVGNPPTVNPPIVNPSAPHVNAFHLWIAQSPERLTGRHAAFVEASGVKLFNTILPAPLVDHGIAEVVIGDGSDGWTIDEAAGWITAFVEAGR